MSPEASKRSRRRTARGMLEKLASNRPGMAATELAAGCDSIEPANEGGASIEVDPSPSIGGVIEENSDAGSHDISHCTAANPD